VAFCVPTVFCLAEYPRKIQCRTKTRATLLQVSLMSSSVNIHHQKRGREEWSAQASQELLRLRFRQLRALFDDAQTVADAHEAWGVVACRLNDDERLQMQVDAVKCSDQLTRLRQQWQESDTAQLHLMMAECFSKSAMAISAAPSQVPQLTRCNFNRAMEEAMLQGAEGEGVATVEQVASKRKKTEDVQTETEETVEPRLEMQDEAADESLSVAETAGAVDAEVTERALVYPQVIQDEASIATVEDVAGVEQNDDDEFPSQNEIMRALEKRSQQLGTLARSHQELADVTQQLMQALVQRHNLS
jgi:hypothetical protein